MRKLLALSALAFTACDFLPGGGGGTGGGSGGGTAVDFTRGYVFVRKDDKNLYAADQRDYSTSIKLTTGGGAKHPSLSFDGKRVAFVKTSAMDSELATVSTAGGMVSTVLVASTTPSARNLRSPVFTPDGLKIVFAYDEGGSSSIGVVNSDGSGFRKLAGGGALAYSGISMYPDGSGVLAAAGSSTSQLVQLEKVSLSTGAAMNVASMLADASAIVSRVVISPDGKRAAFDGRQSGAGAGGNRIFVIDLTTKRVTQLTDYPGEQNTQDSAPCWAAVDQVCFSSDYGGNDQVYALPANGVKTSGGLKVAGASEPWYGPLP